MKNVSFQGAFGAYSDLAARGFCPDFARVPCDTFEETLHAVHEGSADYALIPVDNSLAGRVADIHHLLPNSNLHIIGEYFLEIKHQLLGVKGAKLSDIKRVHSHIHALSQCRNFIRDARVTKMVHADTAGAARDVAASGNIQEAAIASHIAAEEYGLDILLEDIHDADHNTTRFLLMAKEAEYPRAYENVITTLVFRVRNVPAALYKALGGFATNGVNLMKLESYLIEGSFIAAQFYVDIAGHIEEPHLQLALEELKFFSHEVKILGVYPMHHFRGVL